MSVQRIKNQWLWVIIVIVLCGSLALWILFKPTAPSESGDHSDTAEQSAHQHETSQAPHDISHTELRLTAKQILEFGIKLKNVDQDQVIQSFDYPGRIITNTDQQVHVSSAFAGRIEHVQVALGDQVKKGQLLATLFIPELIDQQANLSMAKQTLNLSQQDYQREKQLYDQGISARQDYQRAYNAYRQAQIQVQAAKNRLLALGVSEETAQGRYKLKAPIDGVITQKDIVMGEVISPDKQLFVIDRLDQLWLEFTLPNDAEVSVEPNQAIHFKSLQTQHVFNAKIQTLGSEADLQTGRLQVRAKVLNEAQELRPNLMVNVSLPNKNTDSVLRVNKNAIQQIDGKAVVFVAKNENQALAFIQTPVELGRYSTDGQWVEIKSGLVLGQSYVAEGSFLLKSEMEKGEAEHEH